MTQEDFKDSVDSEEESVAFPTAKDWKNPPTLGDLKQNLNDAQPSHDRQVTKIDRWLDNLHIRGTAKINPGAGHSKVVPQLIRKQAEWRYAALSEPFLSNSDIFKVSPVTWEDKAAAEQNQLVLNHQFNTRINKTRFIDSYVRAAVDEGTVIVRVDWVFSEKAVKRMEPEVELIPAPEMYPMFEQLDQMLSGNPTEYTRDVPAELKYAHEVFQATGVPHKPKIVGQTEVEEMVTVENHPTLEVCDYRNVTIDPLCQGDIDNASFVIYSFETSKSELEKDGRYQNLDKINIEHNSALGDPDHDTENLENFNLSDEARKKFVLYEYWGYWDYNDTGIAEPIVASWVGSTLVRLEANPYPDKKPPFVTAQYLPVRRAIYGEPDGHLLEDNQQIVGAVTRGMIDLMAKSANGQTGIRKDALDIVNRRKFDQGRDYEFNPNADPRQVIYTHQFPEIPQSAQFMLQLQNMEAESITGVKAFTGGISGDSLGKTATGARGALDAASLRELGILRRLSDGVIQIGRKIIAMNSEFLDETEVVRITNDEFVPVHREDLAGNFDLQLAISTAQEDNAKAQELAFMLQATGDTMDASLKQIILADMMKLRKMPDLAKRIEEYQPQPDPMQQQMQQLEIQLLQAKIKNEMSQAMENQAEAMLDQAKALTEQAKARQLTSDADQKDLSYVEQESGVTQERELEQRQAQAAANMQLKSFEAQLEDKRRERDQLDAYLKKLG